MRYNVDELTKACARGLLIWSGIYVAGVTAHSIMQLLAAFAWVYFNSICII